MLGTLGKTMNRVFEFDIPHQSALAANAIVTTVKSQIESLYAKALQKARSGERICPTTLNEKKFDRFLEENALVIEEIVENCSLPEFVLDDSVSPHLKALAISYFQHSFGYPGAPADRPNCVEITMPAEGMSQVLCNEHGEKMVDLHIDCAGLGEFCKRPMQPIEEVDDFQDVFRYHLVAGFEDHPLPKKLAAMYIQLMLQEASEIQECMGLQSASETTNTPDRRAGTGTATELHYTGHLDLEDQAGTGGDTESQRADCALILRELPFFDRSYVDNTGAPLVADKAVREWVHSAAFRMDLRSLTEPSARLVMQRAPINAEALLKTPALANWRRAL